jgi:hypothetical protein
MKQRKTTTVFLRRQRKQLVLKLAQIKTELNSKTYLPKGKEHFLEKGEGKSENEGRRVKVT